MTSFVLLLLILCMLEAYIVSVGVTWYTLPPLYLYLLIDIIVDIPWLSVSGQIFTVGELGNWPNECSYICRSY